MGLIARPNSPLKASDGYAEVDANETTITTAINGNLNSANLASDGIKNTNIDNEECFVKETWDNLLTGGHFPVWSIDDSSVPDSWTTELTPTIAKDDAPSYAPSDHYSCKITGAGASLEGIYQTVELRMNTTYTVNFKVKATAADTAVVKIVDGDDAEKASQEYTDADWQTDTNKKYFTFTTGTTTNAGEIKIKLLAKVTADVVWFAEVQITEGRLSKGYQYISSDANTVNGIYASTTAEANKLLALDASAKFAVDITGDADTVDTIHAATTATANKLLALNASAKLIADVDTVDGIHASSSATANKLLALDANAKFVGSAVVEGLTYKHSGEFSYSPTDINIHQMTMSGELADKIIYAIPGNIKIYVWAKAQSALYAYASTVTIKIGTDSFATATQEVDTDSYVAYEITGTVTVSGWQTVTVWASNAQAQDTFINGIIMARD